MVHNSSLPNQKGKKNLEVRGLPATPKSFDKKLNSALCNSYLQMLVNFSGKMK